MPLTLIRILALLFLFLFISCEELNIDPKNPFEEDIGDQIPEITSLDQNINGSTASFNWEGNKFAFSYSFRIDSQSYENPAGMYINWSDWSSDTLVTLENLDEGQYIFQVKSRFDELEQAELTTANFEIDAITEPALRIYPLRQKVGGEDSFDVYLYVENIDDIAGLQVELQFNSDQIVFIGSPDNCGLESNSFCPELDDNRITILNWNINGDFNTDSPIAQLSFNRLRNEDTEIIISGYTLRNSNNDDIPVDYFFNGIIEMME